MAGCKLTYFDLGGRAFAARVALFKAFGKDGWTDERINGEAFGKGKKEGAYPLGSVPVLTLKDGTVVAQSTAIAKWAAQQGGLYPQDATEGLFADEVIATLEEISSKCPQDPDADKKKQKREEFAAEWMKVACTMLEKRYTAVDSKFLFAEMSLPDLMMYGFIKGLLDGFFDYIPGSYIDDFPKLKAAYEAVKESDLMKSYLENYQS